MASCGEEYDRRDRSVKDGMHMHIGVIVLLMILVMTAPLVWPLIVSFFDGVWDRALQLVADMERQARQGLHSN